MNSLIKEFTSVRKRRFSFWEDLVGEKIARIAVPVSLKRGVLLIRVEDPVWRFELTTRNKNELIVKINETLKKNSIKDIVFI